MAIKCCFELTARRNMIGWDEQEGLQYTYNSTQKNTPQYWPKI